MKDKAKRDKDRIAYLDSELNRLQVEVEDKDVICRKLITLAKALNADKSDLRDIVIGDHFLRKAL